MTRVGDTLDNLADCLRQEVEAALPTEPLDFCGVIPGEVASFDYVDGECGAMGWVRLGTFYPSLAVGELNTQPGSCGHSWSFDVDMGVVRCYEVTAEAPDPEDVARWVDRQFLDMMSMVSAIKCCFAARPKDYIVQPYVPILEGNVIGGAFQIVVSYV